LARDTEGAHLRDDDKLGISGDVYLWPFSRQLDAEQRTHIEATKDECRQAWGLQRMDEIRADLRLTFRALRNNPGFAAIAILSLALGIGANTAVFGLVDAVMLRLLPVRDPGQLVFVETAGTAGRDGPLYPYFELLRDQAKRFEASPAIPCSSKRCFQREMVRAVVCKLRMIWL
jgi:hypothetical protein